MGGRRSATECRGEHQGPVCVSLTARTRREGRKGRSRIRCENPGRCAAEKLSRGKWDQGMEIGDRFAGYRTLAATGMRPSGGREGKVME